MHCSYFFVLSGFLLALQQCLPLAGDHMTASAQWQAFIQRLVSVVTDLIELVLEVFGGKTHGQGKIF